MLLDIANWYLLSYFIYYPNHKQTGLLCNLFYSLLCFFLVIYLSWLLNLKSYTFRIYLNVSVNNREMFFNNTFFFNFVLFCTIINICYLVF